MKNLSFARDRLNVLLRTQAFGAVGAIVPRIMENLRQRVDPKTGLVRPRWKQMAWDLGVSRSTIARQMAELYACGAYERIYVKVNPRVTVCYYRLKD